MFLPILEYLAESFGPLRIFNYFTFRAILATLTSLVFILFFGKTFIRFIAKQKYGQIIRDEGPQSHLEKKGTPTMGGLLILFSIVFSCLCWGDLSNKYLLASMGVTFLFGVIGLIDDFLKLRYSNSKGLSGRSRLLWEILVALSASSLIYYFATSAEETTLFLPFFKDFALQLGIWFVLFSALVLVATANAVNLTDGLDGLAIMPSVMVAAGMGIIAYISGNAILSDYLNVPYLFYSTEIVIFCGALVGAGIGFLWFNTYPAQIFMGDVGSLSLGAALGIIAISIRQEFILMLMGGVFVIETLSVILQVASFKLTGKRIFKMAPLHHHYELSGLAEPKIIVRFWIVTLILVLFALATFRLR
ncbi:MAG: phospho-N-acetylmuramoyl-pentapeptide-transferase [SAR86 cluster bacterium]|uniref:Phospho-N-acetylmuramoyl-pentapeptide-transferase n=1 Tax=SAR86 cluster bacterium TaxID=2030880 RepID=A0A937LBU8_9GAMM|nr:phospho-N-acetylmuramoyl-pentapeptide-transferase [SAR86 cluster bacterium]